LARRQAADPSSSSPEISTPATGFTGKYDHITWGEGGAISLNIAGGYTLIKKEENKIGKRIKIGKETS
jgi:hypothetical protein